MNSGNRQMKERGRKEATQGLYIAVLKSFECKERLNVPALYLLRKDTLQAQHEVTRHIALIKLFEVRVMKQFFLLIFRL